MLNAPHAATPVSSGLCEVVIYHHIQSTELQRSTLTDGLSLTLTFGKFLNTLIAYNPGTS